MDLFVYREINKASREKDESKIDTLGPYSFCLAEILRGSASSKRRDNKKFTRRLYDPL